MLIRFTQIALMLLAVLLSAPANAQLPLIREAEDCDTVCKAGDQRQDNIWARNYKLTPAFWGRDRDDSITWEHTFLAAHSDLKFGLRYSYAQGHYSGFATHNPKRVLHLIVDGGKPIEIKVPDTGWWDLFETVAVPLPKLSVGKHTLKIIPPEQDMTTNVDSLIIFSGKLESLPIKLRSTIIAQSKHFALRTSYGSNLPMKEDAILKEFERIYDYYSKFMGWEFPGKIPINIIEQAKWPSNATAFQNQGGVHFRCEAMATEQGNWTHEMVHQMYIAHFPGWFDEPSVRVLTTLVFYQKLFPPKNGGPMSDPGYVEYTKAGQDVLSSRDKTCEGLEPILCALVVKYGPEVFSKFFHACAEAGARKEIDFTPGRWLTKDEMMKLLSKAAGEDVTPLFRRWNGFAGAQP